MIKRTARMPATVPIRISHQRAEEGEAALCISCSCRPFVSCCISDLLRYILTENACGTNQQNQDQYTEGDGVLKGVEPGACHKSLRRSHQYTAYSSARNIACATQHRGHKRF